MVSAIFVYVIGYQLLWERRYVITDLPTGHVRVTAKEPNISTRAEIDDMPYCSTETRRTLPWNSAVDKYDCLYWDENQVVYPPVEETAIFIATRVNITVQHLPKNCSGKMTSKYCQYDNDTLPETYYIADIENFTLFIEHSMYVPTMDTQAASVDLEGGLYNETGNVYTLNNADERVGMATRTDVLLLKTILRVAGVPDLDDIAETGVNEKHRSITKRYDGIVILCFIHYDNLFTYNLNRIRYTYNFTVVKKTKFLAKQPYVSLSDGTRHIYSRHGVRIIFIHSGEIGQFDFLTIVLTLYAGVGFVGLVTWFLDKMATNWVPNNEEYVSYMEIESPPIHTSWKPQCNCCGRDGEGSDDEYEKETLLEDKTTPRTKEGVLDDYY
jgi:hypothetical protein